MKYNKLHYLIIGAGGTGGALGAYLARSGQDVTLIARGNHLQAIRKNGLRVLRPEDSFTVSIRTCPIEEYTDCPDVIFLCVKEYSVQELLPWIQKISGSQTVVIPLLNIYGIGGKLQQYLQNIPVTDGCIYIASEIHEPGVIWMKGMILRVIFGVRNPEDDLPVFHHIEKDLCESGILGVLSDNIRRDALLKFSYVSPQGACGLYYGVTAGEIQKEGKIRECFSRLIGEINTLAKAMGLTFDEDIIVRNCTILDSLHPDMTTSLQRDIAAEKQSEIQGLIYDVPKLAESYGVYLPEYTRICQALKKRGL